MVVLALGACTSATVGEASATHPGDTVPPPPPTSSSALPTPSTTSTTFTTATTSTIPTYELRGEVVDAAGVPISGATISIGDQTARTGRDGVFSLSSVPAGTVRITRPGWVDDAVEFTGEPISVTLEPFVVRAIRVTRYNYIDGNGLDDLLELADGTVINTLIFDTKDETGRTLYATEVPTSHDIGAVEEIYDPGEVVTRTHEAGLYAVTRIVTFEDPVWTEAQPEVKLAGRWVDARNRANWEYPLQLAVEACRLGFDEIQFDYVRFPAGRTAEAAPGTTQEERLSTIASFLTEAQHRLHPLGCGVSADIFGIVTSSPTDEGIGQRPEEISAAVDVISPMVYPSHYSPGWLGYSDPNDHPGPITADALDGAAPRMAPGTQLRPWLQAFYYRPSQIHAAIAEAEARGHGWMLWNAAGRYNREALPAAD